MEIEMSISEDAEKIREIRGIPAADLQAKIIAKAMRADVRAVRTHSLPVLDVVDADGEPLMDRYAQWQSAPDDPQ